MGSGTRDEATYLTALKLGSSGQRVYVWQSFLRGLSFDPGPADSDFGAATKRATEAYQQRYGLSVDGVVGQQTLLKAATQKFEIAEQPRDDDRGSNFPPPPAFPPLVTNDERAALFGKFAYVAAPTPDNKEAVRITDGWESANLVKVPIPQLQGIKGAGGRASIRFHRLGAAQLQRLWAAWEAAGLLDRVLSWEGAFNARFVRGSTTNLSNHAFASGFDINYAWNKLGQRPALVGERGSVRELVPIANQHGFYWGGHYANRKDGMHFEIAVVQP